MKESEIKLNKRRVYYTKSGDGNIIAVSGIQKTHTKGVYMFGLGISRKVEDIAESERDAMNIKYGKNI